MSKFAEKVKAWYDGGAWTLDMVANAVRKGKLTAEEYFEITGQVYPG